MMVKTIAVSMHSGISQATLKNSNGYESAEKWRLVRTSWSAALLFNEGVRIPDSNKNRQD